jgi:hypothetical protein
MASTSRIMASTLTKGTIASLEGAVMIKGSRNGCGLGGP